MRLKCPGQDFRWLTAEPITCPNCGFEEEIFSHENKVRCHQCRQWIYKEKLPSCVDWCSAARECIGEERWKQLNGCEERSEQ